MPRKAQNNFLNETVLFNLNAKHDFPKNEKKNNCYEVVIVVELTYIITTNYLVLILRTLDILNEYYYFLTNNRRKDVLKEISKVRSK